MDDRYFNLTCDVDVAVQWGVAISGARDAADRIGVRDHVRLHRSVRDGHRFYGRMTLMSGYPYEVLTLAASGHRDRCPMPSAAMGRTLIRMARRS